MLIFAIAKAFHRFVFVGELHVYGFFFPLLLVVGAKISLGLFFLCHGIGLNYICGLTVTFNNKGTWDNFGEVRKVKKGELKLW